MLASTEQRTAISSWIIDRFGAYGRASLFLGVFLVPVVVNRNALDPFGLQKLAVLWVFGLIALALYVIRAMERRVWLPRPRIVVATAVFLAACGLATAFSQARRLSLFGLQGRYGGMIPLLIFVMIMVLIVASYWEHPERTRHIAWAISLGALGVAIYTIIQQAGLDPLTWYSPGTGSPSEFPASTIGNSNFTGASLAIALPIGLYLAATATPRRRPWLGLGLGLEVLALWYTQSRGAFLAAFMGLAVVGWISRDRIPRWVKGVCVAGATTAAITAATLLWHPWSDARPTALDAKVVSTTSAEGRLSYWAGAWRVFVEHPVVGTGPETFYATFPPHRRVTTASDGSQSSLTDKPHNVLLEYAANTGVLGLSSYLTVVGMAIWYGVRRCRALRGEPRLLLAAYVGMLVAYLTQASVSIDVPALAFTGWVAIGAIATLADPAVLRRRKQSIVPPPRPARPSPTSAWRAFGARAGAVIALVALLGLGLRTLRADVNAGLGRFARAGQLNPIQSAYPLSEGVTALTVAKATAEPEEKLRQLELARDRLERVLHLQPDEGSVMHGLADMYTVWARSIDPSRYSDALNWWQRVVDHDPTNVPLRQTFEHARTQMQAHVSELEVEASARPDDPVGWLRAAKGRVALGEPTLARANLERVLNFSPGHREAGEILATLPP